MIAEQILRSLDEARLEYELIPHRVTMSAGEEAAALGLPRGQVAKTIVVAHQGGHVRAVLPASERLDLHKLRELLGEGKTARLATEAELAEAYPMFELGAVPPFAGPPGDRTIVDRRLAEQESIVVEAGSHSASVRVGTKGLLALAGAELADICED